MALLRDLTSPPDVSNLRATLVISTSNTLTSISKVTPCARVKFYGLGPKAINY